MPIGIIVEPLIKQIALSMNTTYKLNAFDFNFIRVLAQHPKLDPVPHGLMIMDIMAKIYLDMIVFAAAANNVFMLLVNRFVKAQSVHEFLTKLGGMCVL